jgi:hypothetical protein
MWITGQHLVQSLEKWKGAKASVMEYVAGHGTLLVQLRRPNLQQKLYIQFKGCRRVEFESMGWMNVYLQIKEKADPEENDVDFRFQVADGERFSVACWGIAAIETEKIVFIDWPPDSRKPRENYLLI